MFRSQSVNSSWTRCFEAVWKGCSWPTVKTAGDLRHIFAYGFRIGYSSIIDAEHGDPVR